MLKKWKGVSIRNQFIEKFNKNEYKEWEDS